MLTILASIFGPSLARIAGSWAWRRKWWIIGGVGALALAIYVGVLNWQVDHYRDDAEEAWRIAEEVERVNAANLQAYQDLEAEKQRVEQILGARVERKSREADRLGDLVQHILSQERTNACAASPAVRVLLERLRNDAGDPRP